MKKIYSIVTLMACLLLVTTVYSQVTNLGNTNPGGVNYVGWDNLGPATTLDIMNNSSTPNNIDFYINSVKFLQVLTGGDLNVVQPANGYMIDGNYVLRHDGN